MRGRIGLPRGEGGFSLTEVIVATAIAAIAVVGLAYTFSTGRAFINRFEMARAALASAHGRLEALSVVDPSDASMSVGPTHTADFEVGGDVLGTQRWVVTSFDDPADGLAGDDRDANTDDLRHVTVTVSWQMGALVDSVTLTRVMGGP
jgi:prepilin-type N-terminal cleavage/methylation domain-containing protein